ncbi:hypothetical protein ES707_21765 [subsurface metagenome]
MTIKNIRSTEAQNNFGLIIRESTHNQTRYIVTRHGVPEAMIIGFDDILNLLSNSTECKSLRATLVAIRPKFQIGAAIEEKIISDKSQ